MDFGGLDDILDDDDMGYVPTALKKQEKTKSRPVSISRQNSVKSIGSIKDAKEDQPVFKLNNEDFKINNVSILNKQSPKNRSGLSNDQQSIIQPTRRNTLFGLHKQSANVTNNANTANQGSPMSFQDFFKNQNQSNQTPLQSFQPAPRPPLPQKKLQKNSSFTHLSSPQNILQDDLNNSSMASRRVRPPLGRKNQNINNNQSELTNQNNNKSQTFAASKGFNLGNEVIQKNNSSNGFNNYNNSINNNNNNNNNFNQNANINSNNQQYANNNNQRTNFVQANQNSSQLPTPNTLISEQSMQQFKTLFSSQLDFQKSSFQSLLKQERQSHKQQLQTLKQNNSLQNSKKQQIHQIQISQTKQFYQLQIKLYKERELQIKQYNKINKRLEGNIEVIEKMQKGYSQGKDDEIKRKLQEIKHKEVDIRNRSDQLQKQMNEFRQQKQKFINSISEQKSRLYTLEQQLQRKQQQLSRKYKKLQLNLQQQYRLKHHQLQKRLDQHQHQTIKLKQQFSLLQIQRQQLKLNRKLFQTQKRSNMQQTHKQRQMLLQKQIYMSSHENELQIKKQQIQMNQNEYVNKMRLVELQKKKLDVEKERRTIYNNSSRNLQYQHTLSHNNQRSLLLTQGLRTGGLSILNKTKQDLLSKQFYSNQQYDKQSFQHEESNYKKSVLEMRDQFLKSLPKF